MRTTAQPQRSPARRTGQNPASRAGHATARVEDAPKAPRRSSQPDAAAIPVTAVRMLRVDPGLYALRVGTIAGSPREIAGVTVPIAHVSAPFAEDGDGIEVVASFPRRGPWLDKAGGSVILRSPTAGGLVILTVYGGLEGAEVALDLQRLDDAVDRQDQPAPAPARPVPEPVAATEGRDVPSEILLHIERAGDRLFPGRGWVGALGRRMRIEAFSIRPLERLAPNEIEMKGFLPNGGETPWVPGGVLCGTRGRGLPLTGFAVRITPQHADRFEVIYQGSFFAGGISQMHQNGQPCRATTADDPLEAVNVRLIDRAAEAEG